MIYIIVFLGSVLISSISQIILKTSANKHHESVIKEYLNLRIIVAYGMFFVSSLITVLAYRGVPLSLGPVLEASGYIYVAILGEIFLKEKISRRKLAGLIIIILGIVLSSL